ncbi:MAG TPA: hypothetical protein PKO15_10705 [Fibrobacteria bacterium]|nr:hypothetical protein [Fibrobacteria bacterium]HOX52043.1 hypothetical protein [Fibrobacteria bacterium]
MIFALLLSLLSGREIVWSDGTLGSSPIRNMVDSKPSRIRTLAELVAVMERSILRKETDRFHPSDSLVRRFQGEACRIGILDTMDGVRYALVDWRKDGVGFTYMVGFGNDSTELLDYFHERPTAYLDDGESVRLVWTYSGGKCAPFPYQAIHRNGEFRFDPAATANDFKKVCKDRTAGKPFESRLAREHGRRTDLRCDVFELFPSVGACWEYSDDEVDTEQP